MTPKDIGAWLLERWPLVGISVILVAFVIGFALGTFYSDNNTMILAQAEPTPWSSRKRLCACRRHLTPTPYRRLFRLHT